MASDLKLFVNLSLTKHRRVLLSKTRAARRSNPYINYTWAGRAKMSNKGNAVFVINRGRFIEGDVKYC